MVARWPGHVPAGATSDALICLSDFMATCAQITGFDLPTNAAQDSLSFLPALLGQEQAREAAVIHHSGEGMFSVRQGDWKLILGLGSGGFSEPKSQEPEPAGPHGQLYNMSSDWRETGNLWLHYPQVVAQLGDLLEDYQKEGCSRPGAAA